MRVFLFLVVVVGLFVGKVIIVIALQIASQNGVTASTKSIHLSTYPGDLSNVSQPLIIASHEIKGRLAMLCLRLRAGIKSNHQPQPAALQCPKCPCGSQVAASSTQHNTVHMANSTEYYDLVGNNRESHKSEHNNKVEVKCVFHSGICSFTGRQQKL